ncbi:hypothetical protein FG05_35127 [Fusarium graminearum]|nr:hypothetical protein FG05_35127 [Fusarium graminearum]
MFENMFLPPEALAPHDGILANSLDQQDARAGETMPRQMLKQRYL